MNNTIRVADFIVKRLAYHGIKHVFLITGGGAMHLNDAFGRSPDIEYICNHHEQACAIAAEGYTRATGQMCAVNVTSGPGSTNAMTGVIGQWLDSIPAIYLSGQVKFETTIASRPNIKLRQLGDQEINIIDIVRPITKYAEMITDARRVREIIDKAMFIARTGRPGPVWIDVPLNIQGAYVSESELSDFDSSVLPDPFNEKKVQKQVPDVFTFLREAKRPVLIAGHGIRLAGGQKQLLAIAAKLGIPVLTTFNGFDLIPSDDDLFMGRIGTIGNRSGNFSLQNSDLILAVGTRNNIRQVSYNWKDFGRSAKKIVVDIDENELRKPTVVPDLAIHSDAKYFFELLLEQAEDMPDWSSWVSWCRERKKIYSTTPEIKFGKTTINPYVFMRKLTEETGNDDIVVAGNGTACVALFQSGIVRINQRIFWNSGCASMGYDLPAAIGAAVATERKRNVVCIAGDGSIQMNIQELQTIVHHHLPVKIFVLNNQGYSSIRQTQENFFQGTLTGCDRDSGVSIPDMVRLAGAYGIYTERITDISNVTDIIKKIMSVEGPALCEVVLEPGYVFSPKLSSEKKPDGTMVSKPLEDMWPFLPRDEFFRNIISTEIKEIKEEDCN